MLSKSEIRSRMIEYYSDDYKDLHGIRPRHIDWSKISDDELNVMYDRQRDEYLLWLEKTSDYKRDEFLV